MLFIKTKVLLHGSIYGTEFSEPVKFSFRKIRCKLSETWESKLCQYLQRNVCQGASSCPLPPGIHFFVNIGKFGLSYFRELATDFPETELHRLTKFGAINRFMEMNFCFNEKHKKSQFFRDIVEKVHFYWKGGQPPFTKLDTLFSTRCTR